MEKDYDTHSLTYIGKTNFRNTNTRFGVKDADRFGHIYCIGKTGVGKSTLLKQMAQQDIEKGKGVAVIDPHGDVAEHLVKRVPEYRTSELVYFNPAQNPIAFNPLKGIHPKYHHLVTSGLISAFKKIWHESWGVRMEYILRYSLLTLLEVPDATLLDIKPLLTDELYRRDALTYVKDKHTLSFWLSEFNSFNKNFRTEAISPILNKVGVFHSSPILRTVVGQKARGLRVQQIMDNERILIINLSKGQIGEDAALLLGSILVTSMQLSALFRATVSEHKRKPFYLYIDECHSFLSLSVIDILSEARKYKLSLFMANQFLEQLDERIRKAIFGNVGTLISFRVGATDAEYLSKEFYPEFAEKDFVQLQLFRFYLKLMINGATSQGFSAKLIEL